LRATGATLRAIANQLNQSGYRTRFALVLHANATPARDNVFANSIRDRLMVEFEPELIPILPEPYAKLLNCFLHVEKEVKRDGERIHYEWSIHKTTILCEAERHAVWEDE
jgi:hypothetical protein